MREMIHDTLTKVEADLANNINGKCLCDLKTIRFDNANSPDYTKEEIQQLYLLRYYPAYLCEYYYLYKQVVATRKLNKLSILSIGCGCCVDYHGAYLAKERDFKDISYCGVDIIDWDYKESLGNPNFKIIITSIRDFEIPEVNDYNIIIFPKSISEFDNESFDSFLDIMSKSEFAQNDIFIISSSMNIGFQHDESRYKRVLEVLIAKGFENETYNPTKEIKNKGWLGFLVSGFNYPDEIKSFIESLASKCQKFIANNKNCEPNCQEQLNKSPILNARNISFQINHLQKK